MCGPFKSPQAILRLLEIIFSALALLPVLFRGAMLNPWGAWCVFVWFLCTLVPLVLLVMEAMAWNILLAAFLPDWADLCCGLALMCAAVSVSAAGAFAAVFLCFHCPTNILCFVFALVAAVIFVVDAVMQKLKCPSGYLSGPRGLLRMSEAFVACMVITAAVDYLTQLLWSSPVIGLILCVVVVAVCLLVTVLIILLHLLKLLKGLLSFGLGLMEFLFNVAAVLVYVLAIVVWMALGYAYGLDAFGLDACDGCLRADFVAVIVGAFVNLVLYLVDLVLSIKSR